MLSLSTVSDIRNSLTFLIKTEHAYHHNPQFYISTQLTANHCVKTYNPHKK